MVTNRRQLLKWNGDFADITLGKEYDLTTTAAPTFLDDSGDARCSMFGHFGEVIEVYTLRSKLYSNFRRLRNALSR